MDKLLSIIVPSYNMEAYLSKCLGSVMVEDAALLSRLDVIVVNDGSKDRTSEIGHDFERRHPGVVRVVDKPNGAYGSCINAALPLAAGRFVRLLDADDTYDTSAFVCYLRTLETLPETVDMVLNDFVQIDGQNRVIGGSRYGVETNGALTPDDLVSCENVYMYAVAYRTKLLREIAYTQSEGLLYTDTEWTYRPAALAKEIRYAPFSVYRYLVGRTGQSMDPAVCARKGWMRERILRRMADQYEACVAEGGSAAYLARQMTVLLTDLFGAVSTADFVKAFECLRPLLSRFPILREALKRVLIFGRMPFHFSYLDFIYRHPSLAVPTVLAVKWYGRASKRLAQASARNALRV